MTETGTTVRSLLEAGDPDLNGFLTIWEEQKQCPLPLVDWLLERGLEMAAEAARWAATTRTRTTWSDRIVALHPYPTHDPNGKCNHKGWYWYVEGNDQYADCVPCGRMKPTHNRALWVSPTCRDALIDLLDHWIPEAP
jgi:hypothetical protein